MMIKPTQQQEAEKSITGKKTPYKKLSDSPRLSFSLITDSTSCDIGLGFSIPKEQFIDNITFEVEAEDEPEILSGILFLDHEPTQPTIPEVSLNNFLSSVDSIEEEMEETNSSVEDSKTRIKRIYSEFKEILKPGEQPSIAAVNNFSPETNVVDVVNIVNNEAVLPYNIDLLMEQYEDANKLVKEKIVEVEANKKSVADRIGITVKWLADTFIVIPVKSIFRTVHNGILNIVSFLGSLLKILIITVMVSTIVYVLIANVHPGSSPHLLAKQSYDTVKELIVTVIADATAYFDNKEY
ncbi:hypothetical protein [Paenibacillus donghaensis]|uniref:Uncharacterized protein n=1 Tax=Paenibacillus donghaensis TaxID=414771 RepID=A0A2Z2KU94_9BACL|nr:hypothetical protein [Paenibacillus donghaensis]ASA25632.1 hypothetical protein B9T62_35805 [Paenibacillus donghaensis]